MVNQIKLKFKNLWRSIDPHGITLPLPLLVVGYRFRFDNIASHDIGRDHKSHV